jgi:hypothetical protein
MIAPAEEAAIGLREAASIGLNGHPSQQSAKDGNR